MTSTSLLRELRRTHALTYLDLAALVAIPARRLAEAEHGLRPLAEGEYQRLATLFGVSEARLYQPAPASEPSAAGGLRAEWIVAAALVGALAGGLAREASNQAALSALPPRVRAESSIATTPALPSAAVAVRTAQAAQSSAQLAAQSRARAAGADQAVASGQRAARQGLAAPPPPAALSPALNLAPPPRLATPPAFVLSERGPLGCPVRPERGRVVLTQGYGVGSHAPAATWGAVDLAVDGNGDGYAEPSSSWYAPIVATHAGHVAVTLDSWPAGHHVWVNSPEGLWRTGYSHFALVLVSNGQYVTPGTVLGLLGSSGMSSGPHLDYQVWRGGENIDPTSLVGCD